MRKDLWICCSLTSALLEIEILQDSEAYVMAGSVVYFVNSHQTVECHTPCGFGAADKAISNAQQLVF